MEVYIKNKRIKLNAKQAIAKGGEADIFAINRQQVLKLFKPPDHPDYQNFPSAQVAARDRLATHQQKLKQFPQQLPQQVIKPIDLATDRDGGQILGYTMPFLQGTLPLLKYSDRSFRTTANIGNQTIIEIFQQLHQLICQIHSLNVVIGDFNDLNILISSEQQFLKPYLIDADSFQYGGFLCQVFTARFVDPLLCEPNATQPLLTSPHNYASDWYAFAVMLMQCLLYVDPYGGVYKPTSPQQHIPHESRPLQRITIFHPDVKYPKPAIPYYVLSDDLLNFFHKCFEKDVRGEFPLNLLNSLKWHKCSTCGIEHSRSYCPVCHVSVAKVKTAQVLSSAGNVTAQVIFKTDGVILYANLQEEKLHWLYHKQGEFKRENRHTVLTGELNAQMQFWLQPQNTLVGKQGQVIVLNSSSAVSDRLAVDNYGTSVMLAVNASTRYWLYNGQLMRSGKLGAEYVGDVLAGQTQIWLGNDFGFGFYHAGNLRVAFVFDAHRSGINDRISLPAWQGQLIDANCSFSQDICWFFTVIQEEGKMARRAFAIHRDGRILASTETTEQSHWLQSIYGKCAVNNFLLAATDEGVVRLEISQGQIITTKEFPHTEPFVRADSYLFASSQGLYVVDRQQIQLLTIN